MMRKIILVFISILSFSAFAVPFKKGVILPQGVESAKKIVIDKSKLKIKSERVFEYNSIVKVDGYDFQIPRRAQIKSLSAQKDRRLGNCLIIEKKNILGSAPEFTIKGKCKI